MSNRAGRVHDSDPARQPKPAAAFRSSLGSLRPVSAYAYPGATLEIIAPV